MFEWKYLYIFLILYHSITPVRNLLGIKYHKTSNVKETSGGGKSPNVRSLTHSRRGITYNILPIRQSAFPGSDIYVSYRVIDLSGVKRQHGPRAGTVGGGGCYTPPVLLNHPYRNGGAYNSMHYRTGIK